MTRDRFPVTEAALSALLEHELEAELSDGLRAAAPHLVCAWIAGLTDGELLSLRFQPGRDFCEQMRAELTRLAEDT